MSEDEDREDEVSDSEAAEGDPADEEGRDDSEDSADPAPAAKNSSPAESSGSSGDTVVLKVRRQDSEGRTESRRWEEFEVADLPGTTVLGALMEIQKAPKTRDGKDVAPPAFETGCLEEICGACLVLVDGRPRLACGTQLAEVRKKKKPITVEPLSKFELVRDLVVDRSRMRAAQTTLRAWVELGEESTPAPRQAPDDQATSMALARCIDCGACLEACPQFGSHSDFVGAAALNDVRRLNLHPVGRLNRGERLDATMKPGGIEGCGKAQNCVEVCPVGVPLADSLADLGRQTTKRWIFDWLLG